jgi:small-conductance mechanosensitive channel
MQNWSHGGVEMSENLLNALRPYLNAILIGLAGFVLAFILSQITRRVLARPMGEGWSKFLASLVAFLVGIWTIKLILDTTGAAGVVVVLVTALTGAFAIGSERIAGDLLAGLGLFFGRTYGAGDYVIIAGQEGRVASVSLFLTTLETVNGDEIYIRNAEATSGMIVNFSAHPGHLISVRLPLPANQDLNTAVAAIQNAVKGFSPEFADRPFHQPNVIVETAEDGYFIIEVRAYMTERLDLGPEKTRLFLLVVNAVKEAGLSLTFEE